MSMMPDHTINRYRISALPDGPYLVCASDPFGVVAGMGGTLALAAQRGIRVVLLLVDAETEHDFRSHPGQDPRVGSIQPQRNREGRGRTCGGHPDLGDDRRMATSCEGIQGHGYPVALLDLSDQALGNRGCHLRS